ncbi:MAG: hypothetical protein RIQ89_2237 [Bacteroidota bacterium]|jgi:outer membrane protein OmpA-like peptidoglycan-associated protein
MKKKYITYLLLFPNLILGQQMQWASSVINYSSQSSERSSSAQTVLGEPDNMPNNCNSATAWEASTDERKEFLHVGFATPQQISQVTVAENCNPGAVYRVLLYDEAGIEYEVHKQKADTTLSSHGRYFNVNFQKTSYKVKEVKIGIDCRSVSGTNQIDAIGISPEKVILESKLTTIENKYFHGTIERLSDNVNSRYTEIHPVISPDGLTLYYVRKDYPPHDDRDKIWYSQLQTNGEWGAAKIMSEPLNNSNHNSISAVTPDGNKLLLSHHYYKNSNEQGEGWSISTRNTAGWNYPSNEVIKNFSNTDRYFNCYMSNDGKKVFMNVRRTDTKGTSDLYISTLLSDKTWSEPISLGPNINSLGSECCAFLASDDRTLYFSSDGFNGYGNNDIYMAKRIDDSWTNWTKPINMGEPLNSPDWDSYYTIPAKGDYAYFVRGADIYRVRIAPELKPDPVVLIYGKVINQKTKESIGNANIQYQFLASGKEAGIAISSPDSGAYKIVLPAGKAYAFLANAVNYFSVSDYINLDTLKAYQEIKRDLYLAPVEVGQTIRINNIFFDFAKSTLKSESYAELDRLVLLLKQNINLEISLSGHTDDVGHDNDNLLLSQARSNAVKTYLTNNGIAISRLTSEGFGEKNPIASNSTEEGRQLNRRVEFTITKN